MGTFQTAGNYESSKGKTSLDPRLVSIMEQAAAVSPYNVTAISGVANRSAGTQNHPNGWAMDVQLADPQTGEVIPNYQNGPAFQAYEQFAQTARVVQQQAYPDLSNDFRWGGYFDSKSGPSGYGAVDLMHFDINPNMNGATGLGSWDKGASKALLAAYPGAETNGGLASNPRIVDQIETQYAALQNGAPIPPGSLPEVASAYADTSAPIPATRSTELRSPDTVADMYRGILPPPALQAVNAVAEAPVPQQPESVADIYAGIVKPSVPYNAVTPAQRTAMAALPANFGTSQPATTAAPRSSIDAGTALAFDPVMGGQTALPQFDYGFDPATGLIRPFDQAASSGYNVLTPAQRNALSALPAQPTAPIPAMMSTALGTSRLAPEVTPLPQGQQPSGHVNNRTGQPYTNDQWAEVSANRDHTNSSIATTGKAVEDPLLTRIIANTAIPMAQQAVDDATTAAGNWFNDTGLTKLFNDVKNAPPATTPPPASIDTVQSSPSFSDLSAFRSPDGYPEGVQFVSGDDHSVPGQLAPAYNPTTEAQRLALLGTSTAAPATIPLSYSVANNPMQSQAPIQPAQTGTSFMDSVYQFLQQPHDDRLAAEAAAATQAKSNATAPSSTTVSGKSQASLPQGMVPAFQPPAQQTKSPSAMATPPSQPAYNPANFLPGSDLESLNATIPSSAVPKYITINKSVQVPMDQPIAASSGVHWDDKAMNYVDDTIGAAPAPQYKTVVKKVQVLNPDYVTPPVANPNATGGLPTLHEVNGQLVDANGKVYGAAPGTVQNWWNGTPIARASNAVGGLLGGLFAAPALTPATPAQLTTLANSQYGQPVLGVAANGGVVTQGSNGLLNSNTQNSAYWQMATGQSNGGGSSSSSTDSLSSRG